MALVGFVLPILAACQPTAELVPGITIERRISPGEQHLYRLALQQDDFIELEVEQLGVDVVVRLFDPAKEKLLEGDLPIGDLGRESLLALAETPGDFRVEVEALKSETSSGEYRLSLRLGSATSSNRLRAKAARLFSDAERQASEGKKEAALDLYAEALTSWREAGDVFWEAETLDRQGDTLEELGRWRSAVEVHKSAAELFQSLGESRFEAISRNVLAAVLNDLGELDQAIQQHSRALELRREVKDTRGAAIALQSLAQIYNIRGETQEALDYFERALELFGRPEDLLYRAMVQHNLGVLYRRLGKRDVAIANFEKAEKVFADLDEPKSRASTLSQIGQLAFELGDGDRALKILEQALELRQRLEDRNGQAIVLSRIGAVLRARNEPRKARDQYLAALELLRDIESPRTTASVLVRLGSLDSHIGDVEQAFTSYAEALALFEKVGDPMGQAESLLGIAVAERQRGALKRARLSGEKALLIAESLRSKPYSDNLRFSFFSTAQRFFDFYIDLLMDLERAEPGAGHSIEALQVSERARARSLLDLLGEAGADVRDDAAPQLLEEERALQKRLNASIELMEDDTAASKERKAAQESVGQILMRLDAVSAEIRRQSPRYAALTQPRPLDLHQIQRQVLDQETVLLEYKLGRQRSFVWLVESETFASFELAPGEEIESAVRQVHKLLSQGHRRESEVRTEALLCDLSQMLLGPIAEKLKRKRLAIVSEGVLQYLPFAALPDPGSRGECREAPPLIAAHEIIYLPSASTVSVLRREREGRPAPAGLMAMLADPVFSADDERVKSEVVVPGPNRAPVAGRYRRLRHSHEEAVAILSLIPPKLRFEALDFAASKETVQAGRLAEYQIVHFATHGVLDTRQPELSGIVLSLVDQRGQPVDGFLRAHEIFNLRLPVDLVVLGACETALGKEVRGEGLMGLTRGFMYAGAPRVMVSLWRVSDRGTSDLMVAFYRALLERKLAPAAALRAAQLAVREVRPQPSDWAGFVLLGEWQPRRLGNL